MRGLAAMKPPSRSRDVSHSFEPDSGLASTECRLCHTVFRETWEEPLRHHAAHFCSPLFLQDFGGRELAGCG